MYKKVSYIRVFYSWCTKNTNNHCFWQKLVRQSMDKTKNKWDEQYDIDVGHLNESVMEQDSK